MRWEEGEEEEGRDLLEMLLVDMKVPEEKACEVSSRVGGDGYLEGEELEVVGAVDGAAGLGIVGFPIWVLAVDFPNLSEVAAFVRMVGPGGHLDRGLAVECGA